MQNYKNREVAHLDFETRSDLDLKVHGTVRYASHPRTVVMHAWLYWRGQWYCFNPASNRDYILAVVTEIHDSGAYISAYNWTFEYNIIKFVCSKFYGWPVFKPERYVCSMAMGLRFGLPGKLSEDTKYLGGTQKDTDGHRVMLRLSKPRTARKTENPLYLYYDNAPDKHIISSKYCKTDVQAEIGVADKTPVLTKKEEKIFRLDQRMNVSGIRVDLKMCRGALTIFDGYKQDLIKSVPKGLWKVCDTLTQHIKVRAYCNQISGKHFHLENMQADTIQRELRTCTDKKVIKILTAYSQIGGQSINKYTAVLNQQRDGRLYHTLQYAGARATGRWAGRGVQLHNINRPVVDYDAKAIDLIRAGHYKKILKYASSVEITDSTNPRFGKPATVADILKSYMRCFIIADKNQYLGVNDYSSIEARKVMYYSECEKGLQLFRDKKDSYKYMASVIYGKKEKDIDKTERFVGKQSILGAGYGMGPPRFQSQCADYGQHISIALAGKTIYSYRREFKEVENYWYLLEDTIKHILRAKIKHKWIECKKIDFMYDGTNVYMRLPSGTILYYHGMHLRGDDLTYYTVPQRGGLTMMLRTIWGGTLLENACQASSRDLMADAMLRTDAHEFPTLLTVHDELIHRLLYEDQFNELQQTILTPSSWCADFPLEIEGEPLQRYRKI